MFVRLFVQPFREHWSSWFQLRTVQSVAATLICFSLIVTLSATATAQPPAQTDAPSQTNLQSVTSPQSTTQTGNQAQNNNQTDKKDPDKKDQNKKKATQFDGAAAYEILRTICDIGPRISASKGMRKQQQLIKSHFEALGAEVQFQPFNVNNPLTNRPIQLSNMIVRMHPERKQRLLFCCHYDTRPFPDQDRRNPQGVFIGANDGGSGVALLCELGKHLANEEGKYGIDFVFFDGEEFVYVYRRDPMFLGSTYFAKQHVAKSPPATSYAFGILVDMIGDANLEIYYEHNSMTYAPRLTQSIWSVAKQLGVREFVAQKRHKIRDDHLPLNEIAKIPTCDIIDFDFPNKRSKNAYWHTEKDNLKSCSADSLGKVGRVLLEWVREVQRRNKNK